MSALKSPPFFSRAFVIDGGLAIDKIVAAQRAYIASLRMCEVAVIWSVGALLIFLLTPRNVYGAGSPSLTMLAIVPAVALIPVLRRMWLPGLLATAIIAPIALISLAALLAIQQANWAIYGWYWRGTLIVADAISLYFGFNFTKGIWSAVAIALSPVRAEIQEQHAHSRKGIAAILDLIGIPQSARASSLRGVVAMFLLFVASYLVGIAIMSLLQFWYEITAQLETNIAGCMARELQGILSPADIERHRRASSPAEIDAAMAQLRHLQQQLQAWDSAESNARYAACAAQRGENQAVSQATAVPVFFLVPTGISALLRFAAYRLMREDGSNYVVGEGPRPALFLRPFGDERTDDRVRFTEQPLSLVNAAVNGPSRFGNIDQILVEEAIRFGPVLAIGKVGQRVPPSGATRLFCANEEWQARVAELVIRSWGVAMCLGSTKGTIWEVDHVSSQELIAETIFLAHPSLRKDPVHDALCARVLAAAGIELAHERDRRHVLGVLHWAGRPTVLWAQRRDESVYQAALRIFCRTHGDRQFKSAEILAVSASRPRASRRDVGSLDDCERCGCITQMARGIRRAAPEADCRYVRSGLPSELSFVLVVGQIRIAEPLRWRKVP